MATNGVAGGKRNEICTPDRIGQWNVLLLLIGKLIYGSGNGIELNLTPCRFNMSKGYRCSILQFWRGIFISADWGALIWEMRLGAIPYVQTSAFSKKFCKVVFCSYSFLQIRVEILIRIIHLK